MYIETSVASKEQTRRERRENKFWYLMKNSKEWKKKKRKVRCAFYGEKLFNFILNDSDIKYKLQSTSRVWR